MTVSDHERPRREAGRLDPRSETVDLVLSEEQLRPRIETFPIERVRLEKYIVTEQRTITVPVRREEIRLVRTPLGEEESVSPESVGQDAPVVVLHEEQVVVTTTVVPVERVWLQKERVEKQQVVSAELRSEKVDLIEHS